MIIEQTQYQKEAPQPGRWLLVDTHQQGASRWIICQHKDNEWIRPGVVSDKVICAADAYHQWAYLPA